MTDRNSRFLKWRTSLAGQVLIRFWISLIVFLSLIGGIQYRTLHNYLYSEIDRTLTQEFKSISTDSEQWLAGGKAFPRNLPDLNQGHLVLFYTPKGVLKASLNRKDAQTNSLLGERVFLRNFIQSAGTSPVVRTLPSGEKIMLLFKPIDRPAGVTRHPFYRRLVYVIFFT